MLASLALDGAGHVSVDGLALARSFDVATRGGNVEVNGGIFDSISTHILGLGTQLIFCHFAADLLPKDLTYFLAPFYTILFDPILTTITIQPS